jgi:hypothetical protein
MSELPAAEREARDTWLVTQLPGMDVELDARLLRLIDEVWVAAREYAEQRHHERMAPAIEMAADASLREQALRDALEHLANPENWMGDPHSQEATLYGHDTPSELARAVLDATPNPSSLVSSTDGNQSKGTQDDS